MVVATMYSEQATCSMVKMEFQMLGGPYFALFWTDTIMKGERERDVWGSFFALFWTDNIMNREILGYVEVE